MVELPTNKDPQNVINSDYSITDTVSIEKDDSQTKLNPHKKKIVRPPDSGFGWVIVVMSLIVSFIGDGVCYSIGVFFPPFIEAFNITHLTVGLMGSILSATVLLVGPFVAYLCSMFSYRIIGVIGSLIAAISFGAPFFYQQFWFVFFSAFFISGIGFGMVYLPSIVIINVWFKKHISLAMGIAMCGSGLGSFLFGPLITYFIENYSWPTALLLTGIIMLIMVPCSMTYINLNRHRDRRVLAMLTHNCFKVVKRHQRSKVFNLRRGSIDSAVIWPQPTYRRISVEVHDSELTEIAHPQSSNDILVEFSFIIITLSQFLINLSLYTVFLFVTNRGITENYSPARSSWFISSIGIGNCVGRILTGIVAGRSCINRFHLYNCSVIISGICLIISMLLIHHYYVIMVDYAVFGILMGVYVTLTPILLIDIFGMQNLNMVLGWVSISQGVGLLIGPPFTGYIYDITNSFDLTFVICGAIMILAGIINYLIVFSGKYRTYNFN